VDPFHQRSPSGHSLKQIGQGSDAKREVQGDTFEVSHSCGSLKGK